MSWWQSKHGPEWQHLNDEMFEVTFWWRDPQGSEEYSTIKRVWVYVTGVTDHHQNSQPQSMQRIAGTNVWQWKTQLSMPTGAAATALFPPNAMTFFCTIPRSPQVKLAKTVPQAIADPLNLQSWKAGRGARCFCTRNAQAPLQPGWDCPQAPEIPAKEIIWKSEQVEKVTACAWIFTGDATAEERPLAVLLDSRYGRKVCPYGGADFADPSSATSLRRVLIDAIDTTHRAHELPCNADFWLAVQQELLPLVKAIAAQRSCRSHRGCRAEFWWAFRAVCRLHWPERFGCVLSQSGSYWWPHRGGQQEGVLPKS